MSEDIKAIDVKVGEGVTLGCGDTVMFTATITLHRDGTQTVDETGAAYVERDGVLEIYPDWHRPFVDPDHNAS